MTYELTADGLVTSDPQIAVMFLGEEIDSYLLAAVEYDAPRFKYISGDDVKLADETTIPRPLILKAIEPVERESMFMFSENSDSNRSPCHWRLKTDDSLIYVKVSALTINQTIGELRTLLSWADPKNKE